jgi:hypothetical protein
MKNVYTYIVFEKEIKNLLCEESYPTSSEHV